MKVSTKSSQNTHFEELKLVHSIISDALHESFGTPSAELFDPVQEVLMTGSGIHIGAGRIECLRKKPELAEQWINTADEFLSKGIQELEKLRYIVIEASEDPLIYPLEQYGKVFKTLQKSALDRVISFKEIDGLINQLFDKSHVERFSDVYLPSDGRDVYWYHRQALLLHLMYLYLPAPTAIKYLGYEWYTRNWLEENYVHLSISQALTPDDDFIEKKLSDYQKSQGLPPLELFLKKSGEEQNEIFLHVRSLLQSIQDERRTKVQRRLNAEEHIVKSAPESERVSLAIICKVVGEALKFNELIHHNIVLAANLLRIATARAGLSYPPMHLTHQND